MRRVDQGLLFLALLLAAAGLAGRKVITKLSPSQMVGLFPAG